MTEFFLGGAGVEAEVPKTHKQGCQNLQCDGSDMSL